jgi:hypothetical protein
MPDTHKTAETNRVRYALLMDRRRVLFELHKLTEAIRTHARYERAATDHPGLSGLVEDLFARTTGALCGRACQAGLPALERDIAELYKTLAALARVWVGLEDQRDLEPLVTAYYDTF